MYWPVIFAGVSGAATVAMGAYAAHSGGGAIARAWLATGAQYGLWHSIALLGIAALAMRAGRSRLLSGSAVLFATGILLFSGSLFARALFAWTWVAPVTPLGGLCFITGWLLLAGWGVAEYLKE